MTTVQELLTQFKFSEDELADGQIPLNVVVLLRSVNGEGDGGLVVVGDDSCDSIARLGMIQAAAFLEHERWAK